MTSYCMIDRISGCVMDSIGICPINSRVSVGGYMDRAVMAASRIWASAWVISGNKVSVTISVLKAVFVSLADGLLGSSQRLIKKYTHHRPTSQ